MLLRKQLKWDNKANIDKSNLRIKELLNDLQAKQNELEVENEELRKTQLNLIEANINFKHILENQNDLIIKFDSDYNVKYVNPRYCETFEIEPKDIIEKKFFDLIVEQDIPKVKKSLESLLKPPHKIKHEEKVTTPNGYKYIEWSDKGITDDRGNITEIIAVGRDKTEEIKLEHFYQSILEEITNPLFITNSKGNIGFVCPNIHNLLGYQKDEIMELGNISKLLFNLPKDIFKLGLKEQKILDHTVITKDNRNCFIKIIVKNIDTDKYLFVLNDVTDLKETNLKLDQVQVIGKIGSWELDLISGEEFWSDNLFRLFGYEPNEVEPSRESSRKLIHPDDLELFDQEIEKAIKEKTSFSFESRLYDKNYNLKWIIANGKIIYKEETPIKVVGTIQDITESKLVKENLEFQEKKYRDFFNNSPVLLHSIDPDGRLLDVNISWLNEMGYKRNEVIGKNVTEFLTPQSKKEAQEIFISKFHDEDSRLHNIECQFVKKNGDLIDISLSAIAEKDKDGILARILVVLVDVTKIRKAEEELRISEERLKTILNSSPFPIAVVDMNDNNILLWGASGIELFGHEPKTSQEWFELAFPEPNYRNDVMESWKSFLDRVVNSTKAEYAGEFNIVCKDGSKLICEFYGQVINQNIIFTTNNITARKKAEDELKLNEVRFKNLFNKSAIPLCLINKESAKIEFNKNFGTTFGYKEKEIPSAREWWDLAYPDPVYRKEAFDLCEVVLKRAIENKSDLEPTEYNITCKNGDVRSMVLFGSSIGKDWLLTFFDITERKQAEYELRDSKSMIENIINTVPVSIFWKDKNLVYLGCNLSFAKEAGFSSPQEIIGKDDFQMGWKEQAELYRADDKQVIESGTPKLLIEEELTSPQGNKLTILTNKVPLVNSQGEIIGVLGSYLDITERKKVQDELHDLEARFSTIFKKSPLAIALTTSKENTFIEVNPAWQDMAGYTYDEAIGKSSKDLNIYVNPEKRAQMVSVLKKHGEITNFEFKARKKSGDIIDILFSAQIIELKDEFFILSMALDNTKRKEAERLLKENENRLKQLFDKMINGVAIYEPVDNGEDFVFVDINKTGEKLSKLKKDNIVGKKVTEVFPGVVEIGLLDTFRKVNRTGKDLHHPLVEYKDDRLKKWVENFVYKLPNGQIVAIFEDSSAEKFALQELEKSEKKYRHLFENSVIGITVTNLKGKILDANPSAIKMLGYTKEEMLNLNIINLYGNPDDRNIFLKKIKENGKIENMEFQMKHRNGCLIWTNFSAIEVFYEEEPVFITTVIIVDERKKAEEKLNLTNKKLRSLSQKINNLIEHERAEISREIHDVIGQALTSMKFDVSWLIKEYKPTNRNIKLKLKDIKDLIDKTTSDVQKIAMELRPGLLDDLGLIYAINWYSKQFSNRTNINCNVQIYPEEFLLNEKISIELFRIIQEALTNVSRHAKASKVNIILSINKDILQLKIIDNGIGITEDEINNPKSLGLIGIFERVYSINGDLKITGKKNIGTELNILLPINNEVNK